MTKRLIGSYVKKIIQNLFTLNTQDKDYNNIDPPIFTVIIIIYS